MKRNSGHALGVFLAALLGVVVGAVVVWALVGHRLNAAGALPSDYSPAPAGAFQPVSKASQDAITAAVKTVGPAVVSIVTRFRAPEESPLERILRQMQGGGQEVTPREGEGSGIVIDSQRGYVLTNAHVVKNAANVTVQLRDGRSFDNARVIGADPLSEVAVIQIPGNNKLPAAQLGDSDALPVGAWVIAIGNPFGFQNSVTVGVLSAKDRQITGPSGIQLQDLMQTDASINPGNSGGALVDVTGRVVGIPTAEIEQAQGMGFAVPINAARQVASRLIRKGKMPWLGISHMDLRYLRPEQLARLHVPEGKGSFIAAVIPGGPAATAGLREGDVIIRAANKRITKAADLSAVVRSYDAGDLLPMTIWRDGREVNLTVHLGGVPEDIQLRRR